MFTRPPAGAVAGLLQTSLILVNKEHVCYSASTVFETDANNDFSSVTSAIRCVEVLVGGAGVTTDTLHYKQWKAIVVTLTVPDGARGRGRGG